MNELLENVVVADKNLLHMNWPLERFVEIFPASDNIIRVAKVKT